MDDLTKSDRFAITKSQFRLLLAGLPVFLVVLAFVPCVWSGQFVAGFSYLPAFLVQDHSWSSEDFLHILWSLYLLHTAVAGLILFAAFHDYKRHRRPARVSGCYLTFLILIVAYYGIALFCTFVPQYGVPLMHLFPIYLPFGIWGCLGIAAVVLGRNAVRQRRGWVPSEQYDPVNDPMNDRLYRALSALWRRLTAKRVRGVAIATLTVGILFLSWRVWRGLLAEPLVNVAKSGTPGQATWLLRFGADPNAAVFCNYYETADPLGHETTSLEEAVDRKSLPMVRALVDGGARISSRSDAFDGAVASGDVPMVRALLEHCDGPLDSGVLYEALPRTELFDLLRAHGANPDVVRGRGHTALGVAAADGNLRAVKFLLAHGAHINVCDGDGWTAILCAGYGNQRDMVRFLTRCGADNSMDCIGAENTQLSMDQAKGTIRDTLADPDKHDGGH